MADVLGRPLAASPRRVPTRRGALHAVELDADRALARWIGERRQLLGVIAERGTYLDAEDIDRVLALSLPGVDELVGLIELTRLARSARYDSIVVDTAPTGHTLRLLEMPETLGRFAGVLDDMQAKHRFLASSLGGAYRPDAGDALIAEIEREAAGLATLLRDPACCRFAWVLLPETLALEETRDGLRTLGAAGIDVDEIIVTQVTPRAKGCAACAARRAVERPLLEAVLRLAGRRPVRAVAALPCEPRGVAALRAVGRAMHQPGARITGRADAGTTAPPNGVPPSTRALRVREPRRGASTVRWLDAVAPAGVRLVIVAGKGGVGKTSCAATLALALGRIDSGRRLLLLSTDPAHSLADAVATPVGDAPVTLRGGPRGLRVRELDARSEFARRRERYRAAVDEVFDAIGRGVDASFDRAVVQNLIDLAPPGLDELLAILTIIEALGRGAENGGYETVVLDTAPTGHALRLLALPGTALEWVRVLLAILLKYRAVIGLGDLASDLVDVSRQLRQLQALLRDPGQTRAVVVTRAGEVPERESRRLTRRLRRLGIPIGATIVNAVGGGSCGRCRRRARAEAMIVRRLRRAGATVIAAPAVVPPPRGVAALSRWGDTWTATPVRSGR